MKLSWVWAEPKEEPALRILICPVELTAAPNPYPNP